MRVRPAGRRLAALVATAVAAMAMAAPAARALSCAGHPLASPQAIAAGTERLAAGGSFRDHYDGAIFGTVLALETEEDGQHPQYGRTEVVVEVTGTYGPEVGRRAVVVQDDPGWLNGYAFVVGTHYFIPYVRTGAGLYSHLCDPITEVDLAEVPALVATAEKGAWPPASADADVPTLVKAPASGMLLPWIPAGMIAVAGVAALVWSTRHQPVRRPHEHAG